MKPAALYRSVLSALLIAALPFVLFSARAEDKTDNSKVIAGRLQPFVDSNTLAGAVTLVASKDKVLSFETVGYFDIAAKKPMSKDAIFWIASMSKPITATAFMILVDEGKVKVDDPVTKYLPEFKDQWMIAEKGKDHLLLKKPDPVVTIEHLLTHTSGLPFASKMEQPTLDRLTLRDGALSYAMTPLQSKPGARFQYSNAGINTVGRIIEVVSGMPYEKFLDKRLFGPLGMKDTTFWPNEKQLTRLAKAYRPKDGGGLTETKIGQLTYPLNDPKRQPMPAGGLFSTADDLRKFCQMVLNEGEFEGKRILSKKAVQQMAAVHTGKLPQVWGLGWHTSKKTGGPFGHGGAFSTQMEVNPDKGLVLVYLVHHAGFPGNAGGKIYKTFKDTAIEKFGK